MSETIYREGEGVFKVGSFATLLQPVQSVPRKRLTIEEEASVVMERAKEEGMRKGYEAGFTKGEAQGYYAGIKRGRVEGENAARAENAESQAEYQAELAQELAQFSAIVQSTLQAWSDAAEQKLLDKVTEICREVLRQELSSDRTSILPIIQNALKEVADVRAVKLRVNPFDRPLLNEQKDFLIRSTAGLESIEIVDDPDIAGGVIVESNSGSADATIETKLVALHEAIQARMEDAA